MNDASGSLSVIVKSSLFKKNLFSDIKNISMIFINYLAEYYILLILTKTLIARL